MSARKLTLDLDGPLATAWESASPEERRRLEFRLRLEMRKALNLPKRSLEEIMDEASQQAAESGLTQEKLDEILNDR
jgi:hypothetical protein